MRAPIFPPQLTGTKAQQYLHRARQFREAATDTVSMRNGEQNWPKYALITHAIELSLKAFAHHSTRGSPIPNEPHQHDLVGWYRTATALGLPHENEIAENIAFLNELHRSHFMRYPKQLARPIPDPEIAADATIDHLLFAITPFVNPR